MTLAVVGLAVVALGALLVVMAQPFIRPGPPLAGPKADPERLEAHVRALAGELSPRSHDPDALKVSADYILAELARHGPAQFQRFDVSGVEHRNVVLLMGGSAGPAVIVGAHYDAYAGLPGADDNASGVAGLLELARLLAARAARGSTSSWSPTRSRSRPYFGTRGHGQPLTTRRRPRHAPCRRLSPSSSR